MDLRSRYQGLNGSQRAAVLITAAIVAYLVIANIVGLFIHEEEPSRVALTSNKNLGKLVKTETLEAKEHPLHITLYGFTEANRVVKIKAQTEGEISEIMIQQGSLVAKGDVIMRIDERDRKAQVEQANALVRQRTVEYEAARKLRKTGAQSEVRLAQSKAQFEEAKALLSAAEEDYNNTYIRAPFDGVLEEVKVEEGDLVGRGFVVNGDDSVATIVEYHPMIVSGQVPQQKRALLKRDEPAMVHLLDGNEQQGRIRFVGSVTDPATRTFRVEVEIDNPSGDIPVGVSAELYLPAGSAMAYHVSPSVLSVDDDGNVGVKLVDEQETVQFHKVELLEDSGEGVWIGGLPDRIRIITLGHNFVNSGQSLNGSGTETTE